MRHPQYGRTWWGAQWLLALSQIDHDNRLPLGRSYAHRGAVRDLLIAGGQVSAEVQGSRPRPYRVEIGVPAAEPALVGRLLEALTEDPGLIARLQNHDLDPALLPMAQRLRMPIFPARWSDLRMHCCCPDSAVPCKHLAAVVYLLSQQIDADPFLVFQLRGIDLGALRRQRGVPLDAGPGWALPRAAQALFGAATGPDAPADDNAGAPAADPQALARLDFTAIPDCARPCGGCCPPARCSIAAVISAHWPKPRWPGLHARRHCVWPPRRPRRRPRCPAACCA